jgi:uncharacterized protein
MIKTSIQSNSAGYNPGMSRRVITQINRALDETPCTILTGPRQIGKTTLARQIAVGRLGSLYLDCERPSDLARLSDPELLLASRQDSLVVLDEVQRAKGLFPVLRSLIDDNRRPGRFLLLGSASPELMGLSAESLAGRARVVEMSGFDLTEIAASAANTARLWIRGGFPLSFLASSDTASLNWREDFIRMFLERDLPQLGIGVPAAQLRRFWTMLAHHHGQIWNASQFAQAFGMSSVSMHRYLGILESAGVIRIVNPFAANLKKRLVKSPRTYIRDTGLLHALLGLNAYEDVLGSPIAGASWEGFVVEQIALLAPQGASVSFFRTSAGAELDLVVEKAGRRFAFEVKLSTAPTVSKGFWIARNDVKPEHTFVVAPVGEAYPLAEGVDVIPPTRIAELFTT